MIQILPPSMSHVNQMGQLTISCIFSCNTYFDPDNVSFGNLIAFNEYVIQPNFGFHKHPHENTEQVFITA